MKITTKKGVKKAMAKNTNIQTWDEARTTAKANTAGGDALKVGGIVAALITMLRLALGDKIPWAESGDVGIATATTSVITAIVVWVRTFNRDKAKHSGGVEALAANDSGRGYVPSVFMLWLAVVAIGAATIFGVAGCITATGENGEVLVQLDTDAIESLMPLIERIASDEVLGQVQEALTNIEAARTENNIAEADAQWARVVDLLKEAGLLKTLNGKAYVDTGLNVKE